MNIISGVYWNRGGQAVNQDSVTLQQAVTGRGRVMMAAVSDGIGGLPEGETASGYITEKLVENFYGQAVSLAARGKRAKFIRNSFLRCFCSMNEELRRYAEGKGIRLGATVSLLFIWRNHYLIFHLGDSRIYQYHSVKGHREQHCYGRCPNEIHCDRGPSNGVPVLLTTDHSRGGHGISRCMGSFPYQRPDIQSGTIHGECAFLLCTDGFYRTFDKETAAALNPEDISGEGQIEKRLKAMASCACRKGEKDNMSAIYLIANRGKE
ncbi:MAG: protein phosphatase 2C domain-containing protein [Lachnospiraceae bacterium]|nr:protein phosphatase 2C domain-containing protein [Lachnospiraceae bacterium]